MAQNLLHLLSPESDPASVSMTRAAGPPSVPFWESLSKGGNSPGYHMASLLEEQKQFTAGISPELGVPRTGNN